MIVSARRETSATVAGHYDDLDRWYRELWGLHVHHGLWRRGDEDVAEATDALVEHAIDGVPLSPASRVCDIGCGYGETARKIARDTGARVVGLTVSRVQRAQALALGDGANPRILLRDWMRNRLPPRAFDLVYAIESSEHMPDLDRFFDEAARVLAPGGALRVCAWLSRERPSPLEVRTLLQPICSEGRLRLATEAEYSAAIRAAGLTLESTEDLSARVKRTWTICLQRMLRHLATRADGWRFLLSSTTRDKRFALSLARIRLAYETGSMRYALFRVTSSRRTRARRTGTAGRPRRRRSPSANPGRRRREA